MQATSLYDENKNLLGSNTVIFDLAQMSDEKIKEYEEFFAKERGWGAEGKTLVFGIYKRNGQVMTFPVPDRKYDTLMK